MGNSTSKTFGSSFFGTSDTEPTSTQPVSTSVCPRTLVFMTGLRTNAAGGMVRMAPTMAPITPKPRKSARVMGSFCSSSANYFVPSRRVPKLSLALATEPVRRKAGLYRVIGLIIYRVGCPGVRLHEPHVERHHRRDSPQGQQRHAVAPPRAAVPEAHPPPQ